jgi:hypothetical protein
MARSRLELQSVLENLVAPAKVYYQPPSSMQFPCLKYERALPSEVAFADNVKYALLKGYTITIIDRNPDSLLPDLVEGLRHCEFVRSFETEGLHHFVYQLFF